MSAERAERKGNSDGKKKTFDEMVSHALKMCWENRKLNQQLREVSKTLKCSEFKCQKLSTDLGQIKSQMTGLLAKEEKQNAPENMQIEKSKANITKLKKEALNQMLIEKCIPKDVVETLESLETSTKMELFLPEMEKQHKNINFQAESGCIAAIFIACFKQTSLKNDSSCEQELKTSKEKNSVQESLKPIEKDSSFDGNFDHDYDYIDTLLKLLKYGFFGFGLVFVINCCIYCYLVMNNMEVSIQPKINHYF